jgi:hypothetical protein
MRFSSIARNDEKTFQTKSGSILQVGGDSNRYTSGENESSILEENKGAFLY